MKVTVYNEDLGAWLCYCGSRPLWTTDYAKARQYTTAQGAAIQAQYRALGVHLTLDFVKDLAHYSKERRKRGYYENING